MSGWSNKSGSAPEQEPSDGDSEEPSPAGNAAAFREGLAEHVHARAELAGLEAKEAGQILARRSILGLVAGITVFFAYTLILVAAVSLIGGWLERAAPESLGGIGWQVTALVAGFLHAVLALLCYLKLKRKLPAPLFEYTRAEFQKDRVWLQNNKSGNKKDDSP